MTPRSEQSGPFMTAIAETLQPPQRRHRELDMDYKLELIIVPVGDVDRAKAFYTGIGFVPDQDHQVSDELRFVQLTPPGSACSIAIGTGLTAATPGTAVGMQLVVADADAARAELAAADASPSEVQEFPWGRFVQFADPDGNRWSVQELPPRP
jgi:catechol 2,3-dioxygenase-like lactoylglutathione lyase family enzyme